MRHTILTELAMVALLSGPVSSSLSPSTLSLLQDITACKQVATQYCHANTETIECLQCLTPECIDQILSTESTISSFDPFDDVVKGSCQGVQQCGTLFTSSSKEETLGCLRDFRSSLPAPCATAFNAYQLTYGLSQRDVAPIQPSLSPEALKICQADVNRVCPMVDSLDVYSCMYFQSNRLSLTCVEAINGIAASHGTTTAPPPICPLQAIDTRLTVFFMGHTTVEDIDKGLQTTLEEVLKAYPDIKGSESDAEPRPTDEEGNDIIIPASGGGATTDSDGSIPLLPLYLCAGIIAVTVIVVLVLISKRNSSPGGFLRMQSSLGIIGVGGVGSNKVSDDGGKEAEADKRDWIRTPLSPASTDDYNDEVFEHNEALDSGLVLMPPGTKGEATLK